MINRINFISLAVGFVIILTLNTSNGSAEKEIPETRLGNQGGGGHTTMTFLYCHSCGYRKAFEEYSNIISNKYPDFVIIGDNYDPPTLKFYLSKCILYTKLVLIFMVMLSFNVFAYFNKPSPNWFTWCMDNKLYACLMLFFVGNMLEAQLISSGAFEISLNDVPVWSKLQTGRIPAPQELFSIIESQIGFTMQ